MNYILYIKQLQIVLLPYDGSFDGATLLPYRGPQVYLPEVHVQLKFLQQSGDLKLNS